MSPQGKKIWGSRPGVSLLSAWLHDKPLSKTDELTIKRLVRTSKNCQQPKLPTLQVSEMLTPSEIEQLRQEQNAQFDLLQKEFPKARIIR